METIKSTQRGHLEPLINNVEQYNGILLNEENCIFLFNETVPLEAKQWVLKIVLECNAAMEKHPNWPKDEIHGAAIVGEESGELLRAAIQNRYEGGHPTEMSKEAIQTGAMALRFLLNLKF